MEYYVIFIYWRIAMFFRKKKAEEFEVEIVELIDDISEETEDICISEFEDYSDIDRELRAEEYEMAESFFTSNDGSTDVAYYVFSPKHTRPKAIIQLCHDACDYLLRYEHFALAACRRGYIFCGNDHLGHGYTAESEGALGFTAADGGAAFMVKDAHKLTRIMKNKHPELPVILVGQGMGTLIAKLYAEHFARDIAACVLMGDADPDFPAYVGKKLSKIAIVTEGEWSRSEQLHKFAFRKFDKKFKKESAPYPYLTRDEGVREDYADDNLCSFKLTARAFYDIFDMLAAVSKPEWAEKIDKELPILIASGECDPVGNYGKGVKKVYDRLKDAGVEDLTLRLYTEGRHELLFETNKEVVIKNTIDWIEDRLEEKINEA